MANSAEWKQVPLVASVDPRYADTSIDGLLTNGYLEKDAVGATWTRRRAGFTKDTVLSNTGGNTGLAIMTLQANTYISFRNNGTNTETVWINGGLAYTYTLKTGLAWLNQSTVTTLTQVYASNGGEGAYKSGGGAFTKIIDVNYPATTLNGSAFLNGYLYVLDQNGSIWGTPNQNDFSLWSPTNVVNAWGTIGQPVAIRKYLNEVLVFKTYSVEVFYDAGISVGSPLLPVQQINIKWGCVIANTIVAIDEEMFWVGNSDSGLNAVIRMNQFNPTPISTPQINRMLSANPPGFIAGAIAAFSCTMGGNKFYCLSFRQLNNNVVSTVILAYNLATGEWSNFNTPIIPNNTSPQPSSCPIASANNSATDVVEVLLDNGIVIDVDDSVTVDSITSTTHVPISMRLRTDNFDAGTMLRKMVSGLRLKADQKGASTLRIRWSDDDYQTWSAWRGIDLSKTVPMLPGLQGTFAKRAYEVEYSGVDKIRFSHLELLIAQGDI